MKRDEWVENQMHDLLPTSYYHVVFTLPSELRSLVLGNRKIMYDLLFDASSETLLTIAKDSTYLGGTPGITSVLHTSLSRAKHTGGSRPQFSSPHTLYCEWWWYR